MIQAILLDLFGTVIAYGEMEKGQRLAGEALYHSVTARGGAIPYAEFKTAWEGPFFDPLPAEEDQAPTPFLSRILHLFRHYGLSLDLEEAERAASACLACWDDYLQVPDDTLPTLRTLRAHYPLALVSNFDHPPYVRALLARYGLLAYFDPLIISGELRIDKPDPRIFRAALTALDCPPERAVFVGDNLETDIAGSRAVGCRPILIDMADAHPDYPGERIRRLSELLPLLDGAQR